MNVLVLAATPLESALLQEALVAFPHAHLVVTGVGGVNAAHALTRAFTAHLAGSTGSASASGGASPDAPTTDPTRPVACLPDLVLQIGIAGAFVPAGLPVGSVALATEEVYADVGVITPDGWLSAEAIGIPLVPATTARPPLFNHFPLDASLVERAATACGPLLTRTGRFLTLSQVTGVRSLGDELHERFGALCESMEGAAAAHVCALYDVPFLELRGISNLVEDRDRSKWRIKDASGAAQHAALRLLEHLDEVLAR